MASWEDWIQDVGRSVIDKSTDARYTYPFEVQKLRLQALGDLGLYEEGQPGAVPVTAGGGSGLGGGGVLLLGGLVLLLLVAKG